MHKVTERAGGIEQFAESALLARLEHIDAVRLADSGEAVRDHDAVAMCCA